jgi:hypothetical protein
MATRKALKDGNPFAEEMNFLHIPATLPGCFQSPAFLAPILFVRHSSCLSMSPSTHSNGCHSMISGFDAIAYPAPRDAAGIQALRNSILSRAFRVS